VLLQPEQPSQSEMAFCGKKIDMITMPTVLQSSAAAKLQICNKWRLTRGHSTGDAEYGEHDGCPVLFLFVWQAEPVV
jgi:hypothetical protein